METLSTGEQGTEYFSGVSRRRFQIFIILLSVNTFILGGCVALLLVNRLLNSQLDVYVTIESMAAGSTVLDLMDDLIPIYFIYGGGLLVSALVTASVWAWMMAQSHLLRYGVILLGLVIFVVLGGMWLLRIGEVPSVPPTTPTPVGLVQPVAVDIF